MSYGIAATVVNPQTSWQRVVLDGDEVVGFVSANFDPDAPRSTSARCSGGSTSTPTTRVAASAASPSSSSLEEARTRGMDHVDVIYEAGEDGPEAFFQRVGFTPVGETEYGEVIAEIRI